MAGTTRLAPEAVAQLGQRFRGELLRPGDPGYDEARHVHNGLVDKRPALIARCRGTADVAEAVSFGREHNLEVAVRGGGHNVAGRATVDDGLMVDLSAMKGIYVDPKARTARAQGGVTWAELDRETQRHGLATTGGAVSSTGIAGLTLGGGLGWLMGKLGVTADNLLSVEIVTAAGRILTANGQENPELFWAVRGGGGNFGAVASLEYRLHPVGPTITGGFVLHPFDRAGEVLRFYRDVTSSLADELTVYAALLHGPEGSKVAGIAVCHCGPVEQGEAATRGIKGFGTPVVDVLGPMKYCDHASILDAAYPRGALNYWKSTFLSDLSDEALRTIVDRFAECPSPMTQVFLEHMHGAVTRVGVGETAFPHRAVGFNLLLLGQWQSPTDTGRCTQWVRETYQAMSPFAGAGRYVNYLDQDETGDPAASAYGPSYRRLQQLKAKYDPGNFFHLNQNIRPLA